jgi:sugar lactone lactonase YvrE
MRMSFSLIIIFLNQGLLKVSPDKDVEVLAVEAEGVKFGLTDGIDVGSDGTIYFTDASYKYNIGNHMLDILEARPHGRLMSFDPSSKKITVLVRDLYFANGVSVAPDQNSLIYCETVL